MRMLQGFCAVGLVSISIACTAAAADRAVPVPQSTLASMGFGAARTMSDADGLKVRGKGSFAIVRGTATAGGTTKSYLRVGSHFAAKSIIVTSGGATAGGGAFAFAK